MRIVHILTRFVRGGSEENTILSCLDQASAGHDVHLVHGDQYRDDCIRGLGDGVARHAVRSLVHRIAPVHDLAASWRLFLLVRRLKPDLVHTHQSKAGILGRIAARLAGVPAIVHTVHIVPFDNVPRLSAMLYRACERFCGRFTDLFIHVAAGTVEQYAVHRIGTAAMHRVIASGMAVEKFAAAMPAEDISAWRAGDPGRFLILSMAALEARKRILEFLPIFRAIADTHPGALLALAGEGPERPAIEACVGQLGLGDRVRFLGVRDDPERLLAAADALVICSAREGLPRAAVQARIAGIPVVSTALPQIGSVVTDGKTGYLVPLDQLDAMKAAFDQLMKNPDLRTALRGGQPPFDSQAWRTETMTAQIADAYRTVDLARSQRGRTTKA